MSSRDLGLISFLGVIGGIAAQLVRQLMPWFRWPLDFVRDGYLQPWISLGNLATNTLIVCAIGGIITGVLSKRVGVWLVAAIATALYIFWNLHDPYRRIFQDLPAYFSLGFIAYPVNIGAMMLGFAIGRRVGIALPLKLQWLSRDVVRCLC